MIWAGMCKLTVDPFPNKEQGLYKEFKNVLKQYNALKIKANLLNES